jgi:CheY-like chemotaxis protein
LEQVIMNLAVNARDAMPEGGKLSIETNNIFLDEDYCRQHSMVSPGNYVLLAVSDTGIGMDSQTMSRIFEPFFTTKPRDKGTGLGLATVYGIVKQSGGHIWLYSEPHHGATFKLYFPCTKEAVTRTTKPGQLTEAPGGTETVLLAEDESLYRDLIRESLESRGYRLLVANDGAVALKMANAYQGQIDLLLTDAVMPELNGKRLAEALAGSRPQMKVLYMSGYTTNVVVHHGVLDPGTNFIAKPFAPSTLFRKVREVLDGKAVPSS